MKAFYRVMSRNATMMLRLFGNWSGAVCIVANGVRHNEHIVRSGKRTFGHTANHVRRHFRQLCALTPALALMTIYLYWFGYTFVVDSAYHMPTGWRLLLISLGTFAAESPNCCTRKIAADGICHGSPFYSKEIRFTKIDIIINCPRQASVNYVVYTNSQQYNRNDNDAANNGL